MITDRLTTEKATSAPKLIREASVSNVITSASSETTLTTRMAQTGVLNLGDAERKARIAASIIHDFAVKPRLNNDRGTAIKKRDDTHKMAEANKAFAHYRW